MKTKILLSRLIFIFTLSVLPTQPVKASPAVQQTTVKKKKLTIEERVKIMKSALNLTANEATQVEKILKTTQDEKAKINSMKISDRKKTEKIEYIKDLQKDKLKKVLGKERYKKYKEMKQSDVL